MTRMKLFGLALVAALAVIAAASTSALALESPENLPASTTRTFTGVSGPATTTTEFFAEGQEPIKCTAAPGEGTETSSKPPSGAFHIHFEGCTTEVLGTKVKCTGLGDATGTILALGTWKLVWDRLAGKPFEGLTTAVLFENTAVHFSCSVVLIEVLAGETLCLHLNPTTNSAKHEFHCIGDTSPPKALEEWSATEAGTFKLPKLTASVSHEPSVPAVQLGLGQITYSESVFADQ